MAGWPRTSACRAAPRSRCIGEVFNLFNHENYGAYQSVLNNAGFGDPRQNLLNAYQPRVFQLAFKFTF